MSRELKRAIKALLPFLVMAVTAELVSIPNIHSGTHYTWSALVLALAVVFALGLARRPRLARLLCAVSYVVSISLLFDSVRDAGLGMVFLVPVIGMATTAGKLDSAVVLAEVVASETVVELVNHVHRGTMIRSVASTGVMGAMIIVSIHGLRDRLKAANAKLEQIANTDPLSGLANRRGLERAIERRASKSGFAMISIDVDGLKDLNDSLGHAAGDLLLQQVADACRATLRSGDLLARIGGDEFVAFVPGSSRDAESIAARMRAAVGRIYVEGHRASVSIGVAAGRPDDDPGAVLARADERMYEAKSLSRPA